MAATHLDDLWPDGRESTTEIVVSPDGVGVHVTRPGVRRDPPLEYRCQHPYCGRLIMPVNAEGRWEHLWPDEGDEHPAKPPES